MNCDLPTASDVEDAARRIAGRVHVTPLVRCRTFDRLSGAELFFKAENLQRCGCFKIRGAMNAVLSLPDEAAGRGVVTHSSGNHAQALALAAAERGIAAHLGMPRGSNAAKVEAVKSYGGRITWCENNDEARRATAQKVQEQTGATFIHPYNDARVVAGQGTAARELLEEVPDLDMIIAPIGGGGLMAGTCLAATGCGSAARLVGAEPKLADDAYESMRSGRLQPQRPACTVADGLRTGLGELPFAVLKQHLERIVLVEDDDILETMRLFWQRAKLLIEPSAAVPLAAALKGELDVKGQRVGIILSGGNVDIPGFADPTSYI